MYDDCLGCICSVQIFPPSCHHHPGSPGQTSLCLDPPGSFPQALNLAQFCSLTGGSNGILHYVFKIQHLAFPPCFFNQVIERQLLVANHSQREYWYFSISFCHTQSIILWERGGKIKIISLKTTKYSIFTSRCEPEEQWSLLFISCPLFQVHGIRTYLHYGHNLLSSLLPIDPNYFNLVNIRVIHFI